MIAYAAYKTLNTSVQVTLVDFKTGFEHPADLIEFNGSMVVSELLSAKLAISDFSLNRPSKYITHPNRKKQFSSPHNFTSNGESIFFSGGWGQLIYQYNRGFQDFKTWPEKPTQLNAPHGICLQDDWLYIADSLNSRLLRINLQQPQKVEVFADHEKRIAYGRQLLCHSGSLWLSNSYEKREGLNTGQGANVLRIDDFGSGNSQIIAEFPHTNITGIYVHDNRFLFTAQWHANRISIFDLEKKRFLEKNLDLPTPYAGPPYSLYFSEKLQQLYISFIGDIYGKQNHGGIAVYTIE